jgi:hypothetical protein
MTLHCSELLDERKQGKLQWLQNPSQMNRDNLNIIRHELMDISEIREVMFKILN